MASELRSLRRPCEPGEVAQKVLALDPEKGPQPQAELPYHLPGAPGIEPWPLPDHVHGAPPSPNALHPADAADARRLRPARSVMPLFHEERVTGGHGVQGLLVPVPRGVVDDGAPHRAAPLPRQEQPRTLALRQTRVHVRVPHRKLRQLHHAVQQHGTILPLHLRKQPMPPPHDSPRGHP